MSRFGLVLCLALLASTGLGIDTKPIRRPEHNEKVSPDLALDVEFRSVPDASSVEITLACEDHFVKIEDTLVLVEDLHNGYFRERIHRDSVQECKGHDTLLTVTLKNATHVLEQNQVGKH